MWNNHNFSLQYRPARHLDNTPRGKSGSISERSLDGDGAYLTRKQPYTARMPSGTRTPYDRARNAVATARVPPALSPTIQTFLAVDPEH